MMKLFFLLQTCDIRASPQRGDQVIVSVVFSNLTDHNIKDLEFNVMDTMNLKLIRGVCLCHVTILETFLAQLSTSELFYSKFVRRCCWRRCRKLLTFSSSSAEPLGQFQPNLAKAFLSKRISSLFKGRAPPFSKGKL